ncbi:MAG: helix-turn-helix transcriptional regulator [Thermodesulfobacteriota bacterium]|nr:helix-turn-helix transcriptional regulator [Thermodesulfobacteriota bacterium]
MRKKSGQTLLKTRAKLKRRMEDRTRDLENENRHLKEMNTALKILMEKHKNDNFSIEKKVIANVEQLIKPYLDKLAHSGLNDRQKVYLKILTTNLNEIVLPFAWTLSTRRNNLTPTEMQVANLVRQGRTTPKIAELLSLSDRTIQAHRRNIRAKFNLTKKKTNLRSYLLSI